MGSVPGAGSGQCAPRDAPCHRSRISGAHGHIVRGIRRQLRECPHRQRSTGDGARRQHDRLHPRPTPPKCRSLRCVCDGGTARARLPQPHRHSGNRGDALRVRGIRADHFDPSNDGAGVCRRALHGARARNEGNGVPLRAHRGRDPARERSVRLGKGSVQASIGVRCRGWGACGSGAWRGPDHGRRRWGWQRRRLGPGGRCRFRPSQRPILRSREPLLHELRAGPQRVACPGLGARRRPPRRGKEAIGGGLVTLSS